MSIACYWITWWTGYDMYNRLNLCLECIIKMCSIFVSENYNRIAPHAREKCRLLLGIEKEKSSAMDTDVSLFCEKICSRSLFNVTRQHINHARHRSYSNWINLQSNFSLLPSWLFCQLLGFYRSAIVRRQVEKVLTAIAN